MAVDRKSLSKIEGKKKRRIEHDAPQP
jgi:hypothetical protein